MEEVNQGNILLFPKGDNGFSLSIQPDVERNDRIKLEKVERFFAEINVLLGGSSIEIELTDEDYRVAFNRAIEMLRTMSTASIYEAHGFLEVVQDTQTYVLNEAIDNVIQIYRRRNLFGSAGTGFDYFSQIAAALIYPGSQPGGFLGVSTYDFAIQYEKTLERLFARDYQFRYNHWNQTLFLNQNPKGSDLIVLRCSVKKTIAELLSDVWAKNWLTQYTLAVCKTILGQKRGKFGTLPGAQGGTQLNGDRLIEAGEKAMKELEQSILDFQDGGIPAYPILY